MGQNVAGPKYQLTGPSWHHRLLVAESLEEVHTCLQRCQLEATCLCSVLPPPDACPAPPGAHLYLKLGTPIRLLLKLCSIAAGDRNAENSDFAYVNLKLLYVRLSSFPPWSYNPLVGTGYAVRSEA